MCLQSEGLTGLEQASAKEDLERSWEMAPSLGCHLWDLAAVCLWLL